MKRHEFYTAIGIVDKFFNTSSPEMDDGKLTVEEHQGLCVAAQNELKSVFPHIAGGIMVTPVRDVLEDFAGYHLLIETVETVHEETLEFDFGSEGVDVA